MALTPTGVLCSLVVLLSSAGAFRVKHRRPDDTALMAQELHLVKYEVADPTKQILDGWAKEPESCSVPGFVTDAVRVALNAALGLALPGQDPQNVTLHAMQHEIDLLGCTIGLEMDASLLVGGFKDAWVSDLGCAHQECIEHGLFGICTVTDYTFNAHITFGEHVLAEGEASAQWEVCGLESANHSIEVGVDSLSPGLRASIRIRSAFLQYEIMEISNLETHWGNLQNFRCGFAALPDFIGSVLENWCSNIIEWLAGKVQEHLKDDIDKLLLDLVHEFLNVTTPAPTPAPEPTEAPVVDRLHQECWSSAGRCRDDGATVCDWCGTHARQAMHCCNSYWSYAQDHPCHFANYNARRSEHQCVVTQQDRFHNECWRMGRCSDNGATFCNWCGTRANTDELMYCCRADWSYSPGDKCYGAAFGAPEHHLCVTSPNAVEQDRHHEECWTSAGCRDNENICPWCGMHNNQTMYCCQKDKTYAPGHKCHGKHFADVSDHHCVV